MMEEKHRYRNDPLWDDVMPVPLTDNEQAAVRIATSDSFNDAFMYLRAVMISNEMSHRALELTARCADFNAANYSVWQYRRALLKALNEDLNKEFDFISEVIDLNPKNYQVWQHRRILVEWTDDCSRELAFTASMIGYDSKNYHAWQHRQWVVDKFKLYGQQELDYSAALLLEDLRNNSAWNYRHFILEGLDALKDPNVLKREITMTESAIKKVPNNESAWNYLSGILLDTGVSSHPDVMQFCEEIYQSEKVPLCAIFMVDVLVEKIEKKIDVAASSERAIALLNELKTYDPVRKNFWSYNEKLINILVSKVVD